MLILTASGLTQATWNPTTLVFESVSNPSSVTRALSRIFQNTGTDLNSLGWYAYDLTLSMDNWAHAYGQTGFSYFGSPTVVPEPATMILLATGLVALAFTAALRRRGGVTAPTD